MPDPIKFERENGTKLEALPNDQIVLTPGKSGAFAATITGDDLYWLITTGGPAMMHALGDPFEARGIERADRPHPLRGKV